jgi:hypothetical protein
MCGKWEYSGSTLEAVRVRLYIFMPHCVEGNEKVALVYAISYPLCSIWDTADALLYYYHDRGRCHWESNIKHLINMEAYCIEISFAQLIREASGSVGVRRFSIILYKCHGCPWSYGLECSLVRVGVLEIRPQTAPSHIILAGCMECAMYMVITKPIHICICRIWAVTLSGSVSESVGT